jgi:hypothetical protein
MSFQPDAGWTLMRRRNELIYLRNRIMAAKVTIYLFPDGTREKLEEPLPFRHQVGDILPFEAGTFRIEAEGVESDTQIFRLAPLRGKSAERKIRGRTDFFAGSDRTNRSIK